MYFLKSWILARVRGRPTRPSPCCLVLAAGKVTGAMKGGMDGVLRGAREVTRDDGWHPHPSTVGARHGIPEVAAEEHYG